MKTNGMSLTWTHKRQCDSSKVSTPLYTAEVHLKTHESASVVSMSGLALFITAISLPRVLSPQLCRRTCMSGTAAATMGKTILVTGSTDGIGLETAKRLAAQQHTVLLHGRNAAKVEAAVQAVLAVSKGGTVDSYVADLSSMTAVQELAVAISGKHQTLDVLINNAGVFRTPTAITPDGLDFRFAVNTIAPYLLTRRLLPLIPRTGRVVNLSSAAQAPVSLRALAGLSRPEAMSAYSQSKLGITMWSNHMASSSKAPLFVAVNPGSLLKTKMVMEGFGYSRGTVATGAEILIRAALSEEFANANGKYYDNDSCAFAPPHPDALDVEKNQAVVRQMEKVLQRLKVPSV